MLETVAFNLGLGSISQNPLIISVIKHESDYSYIDDSPPTFLAPFLLSFLPKQKVPQQTLANRHTEKI